MGMSLSGDVFWGIDLGYAEDIDDERMPQWWQDDQDWEKVLAGRLGWIEVPHPFDLGVAHENYKSTPEYKAWSASLDEMRKLVGGFAVEIDLYGYEYDARAVRIKASVQSCNYGASRLRELTADPSWSPEFARFCELLEIPIPEDGPGWHVCATWA